MSATRTARAAVVDRPGAPFVVEDVELDGPREGEVLVRIVAAGLCHTDLGVRAGAVPFPLPGVLGHEAAGLVEEVGPGVTGLAPGTPVLASFTSCGACQGCTGGHPAYCRTWLVRNLLTGTRPDGSSALRRPGGQGLGAHFFGQSAFATHAVLDAVCVVPLEPGADLELLAPLGCSGVTGFGTVRNVLGLGPGRGVAVLGTGAVGLCAVVVAALAGADPVIAVDVVEERLELARELGATHAVRVDRDTPAAELTARLAAITGPAGLTDAFDTTAAPEAMRGALDALGTCGTLAFCGAPPPGTDLRVDVQAALIGKRVVGVTMGDADPQHLVPDLVRLQADGRLPLHRLVRHYPLDDLERAAGDMESGVTVKPVILPG